MKLIVHTTDASIKSVPNCIVYIQTVLLQL